MDTEGEGYPRKVDIPQRGKPQFVDLSLIHISAFIAAFSRSKKITRDEVEQLKALIDNYEEDRT